MYIYIYIYIIIIIIIFSWWKQASINNRHICIKLVCSPQIMSVFIPQLVLYVYSHNKFCESNLQHLNQHLITCLCSLPSQWHPEVGSHIDGSSEEDHDQCPDDESTGTEPERAGGAHIITDLVRTQVHIDLIRVWVLCMYLLKPTWHGLLFLG